MRNAIVIVAGLLLIGAGSAAAQDSTAKAKASSTKPAGSKPAAHATGAKAAATKPAAAAEPKTVVLQTNLGNIVLRLRPDAAPKTCANFRKLVAEKFYDGTCFHRVIAGFMIQGGDPNSKDRDPSNDGLGGPNYTVPAEIKLPHLRGSVATARLGDAQNPERASSGSQFFIDVAAQPSLDAGGYTVFAEVVEGMDVVDKIAAMANDASLPMANGGGRNPGVKAKIEHATFGGGAKPAAAADTSKH
jgi:peptidylprolyl isomerase/peptidyl-prolyl cis-trans isomerase B (cyclophilin B)